MKLPKEIRSNKFLLDGLIVKMRFQNVDPSLLKNKACMTYQAIANFTGRSVTYCRDICTEYTIQRTSIQSKRIMKSRSKKLLEISQQIRPNKLNKIHIDYLISKDTLQNQIGMSIAERAADLTRAYPNKKISPSTLRRIYQKHRVSKKKIKITKIPNRKEIKKIIRSIKQAKEDLQQYSNRGFRIIYLDETMITKSTISSHEWSAKNHNYQIDMKSFGKETIAVIAAISKEYGMDYVSIFNQSVNIPKFKEFLQNIRDKYFFEDICIYMDNLAVHRSNEIKQRLNELSIPCIFSPPYSPDYNPIESVFSIFKREMKVKRLKAIVDGKHFKTKDNIRQIFENINVLKIVNCIDYVEFLFQKQ